MELQLSLPQELSKRKSVPSKPLHLQRNNSVLHIFHEVCAKYGFRPLDLKTADRRDHIVAARNEFFYRAIMESGRSTSYIAAFLGRERTSIIHSAFHHAISHKLPEPAIAPSRSKRVHALKRQLGDIYPS